MTDKRNAESCDSRRSRTIAVAALLFGASLWGLYWLPLRLLENAGVSGLWAVVLIYGGATLAGFCVAHRDLAEARQAPWFAVGIGLTGGVSGTASSIGVLEGNVARVLILFYMSPLWSVAFGTVFLRERLGRGTLPALMLAMGGATMMLSPNALSRGFVIAFPDLLGLVAGIAFALTNVQVRAAHSLPPRVRNLAAWYLVPLFATILALATEQPLPTSWIAGVAAVIIGIVWMTSMVVAVQYGVSRLPLQRSSVILVFELIVGTVSAALIAGETLGVTEVLRGILIIFAGLIVGREEIPEMDGG